MKSKIITILCLLLFCVIVFLPPIIHGYVYPNVGDDSTAHLKNLDMIQSGGGLEVPYIGSIIVGYPIVWISNLTNIGIDPLFLWFSYVALALVGITLYVVMSRLVNKQAGWFALALTIFSAQGILFQFYYGQLFNLINIGIILPWLIYFVVKYLTDKRAYQLVLVIIFAGLFGTFHTCGIYLPFIAGLTTVAYVTYHSFIWRKVQIRGVVLGGSIVVLSVIGVMVLDPFTPMKVSYIGGIVASFGKGIAVPVENYLLGIVSPMILAILIFTCVFPKDILKNIRSETKGLFTILLCIAVLLIIVTFAKLSLDAWRQALDLATILACLAAISVGLLMERWKNKFVTIILVLIVSMGLFRNVPDWFDYNSAIRPADEQAIAYANTLDYESFVCSAEVAPWIYERFMEAEYIKVEPWTYSRYLGVRADYIGDDDSDLLIARSKPMTPRSDVNNIYYNGHGIIRDESFELTKTFRDSQVEVYVYERR